jgi:RHH-type proline utilization regulon transcriptional repressor/proline dehydrogenase/delta 1-pyrroline-5-carboxylate dehydrogenase
VVQFLPCPDDDVGRALVTHRAVGAVILTGAADTAWRFLEWRPDLRLHAETSGKNAIVVTAAADLDLAVRDLVRSAFGHAGQKCSAASLAIVERSVLDDGRFLDKLADATRTLRVGDPTDPATDVGPLIRPPGADLSRALTRLDPGESWLVRPRALDAHGHAWSPGIRLGVAPGSFFHLTECFGPVLGIMEAADLDEAIALQDAPAYGLTGGLHSLDPHEIRAWVGRVQVGNAYVNRGITGAIVQRQPFGGWKGSTVGPAAKAGGPGYVPSLCRWDEPAPVEGAEERLGRARASYPSTWAQLRRPVDPSGLAAERNDLHHLPLPLVIVRIEADADPADVELCRLAAEVVGTPVEISAHDIQSADGLTARLGDRSALAPSRVRVLGTPSDALGRACAAQHIHLDDRRPVSAGAIELLRWTREQSITRTAHRHGTPTPDLAAAL